MFDNLCKSWPRESQQCINRLKNKQTSYRVLNTVLIKVLYERCGSWPQKCYGDGYSTGWLRHFIATRWYEFFNFRSAEARSDFKGKDKSELIMNFAKELLLREHVVLKEDADFYCLQRDSISAQWVSAVSRTVYILYTRTLFL